MNLPTRSLLILAVALQFGATGLAADFTVINTLDVGPGSLRQAILSANLLPGADRIVFNIPGPGVQVIEVEDERLPPITDPVTIDGYTQPGASANTLSLGDNAVILIELRKALYDFIPDGLVLDAGSCVIRGLSITGFGYGRTNSYSGGGITVAGTGGSTIEGNFIGVTPDGHTAWANVVGVRVHSAGNLIGGSAPAARNVISGNTESGIYLLGDNIYNTVAGNYVGTDATGSRAVGNGTGVWFSGDGGQPNNILGGTAPGAGNVISGNIIGVGLGTGTNPFGFHTTHKIVVQGNLIGTAANGIDPLGNVSGMIINGSDNLIGGLEENAGNTIAFNDNGVALYWDDSASNRILSNRIYGNGNIGIELRGDGATPNDPGDADFGPNTLQNHPVITSSSSSGGIATIQGTLNSTPNSQFTLQFFADSQSLTRAGQSYLGSENVTTDGNGNASFSVTLPNAEDDVVFNATTTDADGNTSEFSRNPAHLLNVSARLRVHAGDNALLAGLIQRSGRHSFGAPILRALGPSLTAFGISDPLPDPTLALHDESGTESAFNDNWKDDPFQRTSIEFSGVAPSHDLESALIANLDRVSTAVVRGNGDTTGIGLLEMFDRNATLANFSVRGLVETGDNVMIAGFIIDGGFEALRLVVRAIGPSLAAFGITNPLPDPVLELYDSNGKLINSNDDWKTRQKAELETVGLAPSNNSESAILTRLGPGAYTAILRGKGSATGVALLEYYNLP